MDARATEVVVKLRSGEDDALSTERPWCCVCRRSSDVKWAKHAFTKSHQQRAVEFLEQRATALTELLGIPDGTSGAGVLQTLAARKWSCGFCELHDHEGWSACVDHFASDAHRKKLEAFCRYHRCDVNRELRARLQLAPGKHRQVRHNSAFLMKTFAVLQQQETQLKEQQERAAAAESALASVFHAANKSSDASAMRAEAFLSSAAARLQQVQVKRQTSAVSPLEQQQTTGTGSSTKLMAPKPPTEAARVKTVVSSDGIIQNPLGFHEGRRVWGGGIVKLRKPNEWIPWPIDLLVKEENDRSAVCGGGRKYQDLNGEHDTGDNGVSFTHRVTDMAFGAGLGRISKVAWGDNVANVHTDAVPPWMVQSEDEYKRCNEREFPVNKSTYDGGGGGGNSVQPMWTQQIGRHQNGPSASGVTSVSKPTAARAVPTTTTTADGNGEDTRAPGKHDPNWLPNFGGVWQEGPRSKTKHEFAKTMPLATTSSALQFRPASVYQRRRKVATVSTSSPSSMAPPPPPPPSNVSIATAAEAEYQHHQQHSQSTHDEHNQSKPADEALVPPPPPPLPPAEKPPVPAAPMDEKKRLLLAQKERLRAKMAAKRAPGR